MTLLQLNEKPAYVLSQRKSRALIPKIIILLVLSIIFYLGILLNVSLLVLSAQTETIVKLVSLILLLVVVVTGIIFSVKLANKNYLFYRERIRFNGEEIVYKDILNTALKRDLLDKMFDTYSINLGHDFHLKHISQEINIENYLKQLINYAYSMR